MKMIILSIFIILVNILCFFVLISEHNNTLSKLKNCERSLLTKMEPQTKIRAYISTIDPISREVNAKEMVIDLQKNSVYEFSPEYIINKVTFFRE